MLYTTTVEASTLELLEELMQFSALQKFRLAGGTALSLQLGHRKSIDVDLFTNEPFDAYALSEILSKTFHLLVNRIENNTLNTSVEGVKVDMLAHQYPWVKPYILINEIRFASFEDIAAMKLGAIVQNGQRLKDFVDVAYLSTQLSLAQMVDAFSIKYPNVNSVIALKALNFHEDINMEEPINTISKKYKWNNIEKRIKDMFKHPEYLFSQYP